MGHLHCSGKLLYTVGCDGTRSDQGKIKKKHLVKTIFFVVFFN